MVQRLAGIDIGTFRKKALLNYPVDLRSDFRDEVRTSAARQFSCQNEFLRLNGYDRHFQDWGRRRLPAAVAATTGRPQRRTWAAPR